MAITVDSAPIAYSGGVLLLGTVRVVNGGNFDIIFGVFTNHITSN